MHGLRVGLAVGLAAGALTAVITGLTNIVVLAAFSVAGGLIGHRIEKRKQP